MRFLERLFGKRPARASAATVGRSLAEIMDGAARPRLREALIKDLPKTTLGDAFLALASLSLFAWIRASENEPLRLGSPASRKEIYDNLASFLVVRYVQLFGSEDEPDAVVSDITKRADGLRGVWNNSQDKPPSPHWHVGKAVWFMLDKDRENPDPARITLLSELLTTQTVTLLEFARRVQVTE